MTRDIDSGHASKFNDLVTQEHDRREQAWPAAERWRVLQETIRWAEMQQTARRNTPKGCIEHERRLLGSRE